MGRIRRGVLLIACVLTCVLVIVCHAELHRAKVPPKTGNYIKPKPRKVDERASEHYHHLYTTEKSKPTRTIRLGHTNETWVYSIISAVLVGLSGIFPLLVIPLESGKALRDGEPLEKLHLLLSFAVGGLLGDVFLHLLPEAWAHINAGDHSKQMTVGLWVLVGIFSFMLIEKVFPDDAPESADSVTQQKTNTSHTDGYEMCRDCLHKRNHSHQHVLRSPLENKNSNSNCFYCQHDHKNGSTVVNNGCSNNGTTKQHIGEYGSSSEARNLCSKQHIKTSGWLNLFANAVDNFTHGLAVAGSYCVGTKTGLLTTLAILLHELPHEMGDFAILLRSGFNRWQAAKAQLITASGALIGALTALIAESAQEAGDRTAWILPFTAGGFIYIALVSVVPELMKETNWRESLKQILLLCSGIIVMALVTYLSD